MGYFILPATISRMSVSLDFTAIAFIGTLILGGGVIVGAIYRLILLFNKKKGEGSDNKSR